MSEEAIKDFVRKYTGEDIPIIERYESDIGTVVIIKFEDTEKATNFIETIKASSGSVTVRMRSYVVPSFVTSLTPLLMYLAAIF